MLEESILQVEQTEARMAEEKLAAKTEVQRKLAAAEKKAEELLLGAEETLEDAAAVCENDDFVWNGGEVERWTFDFRKPRGPMCGVCAWVVLPNGRKKWHWMENGEIASIRACVRDTGIWDKWPVEMAKKSALRRMFKTLRNSPAVNALLDMDNENFDLDEPVAAVIS